MSIKDIAIADFEKIRSDLPHVYGFLHDLVGAALLLAVNVKVMLGIAAVGALVGFFGLGWLFPSMLWALGGGIALVWLAAALIVMLVFSNAAIE